MLWWTLRQFRSADPDRRAKAAKGLGDSGDSRALGPLVEALGDESVRYQAIEALRRILRNRSNLHSEAAALLVSALQSPSSNARAGAATLLGDIPDTRLIQPLVGAAIDNDHEVGETARKALSRIAPRWREFGATKASMRTLIGALQNGTGDPYWAGELLNDVADSTCVEPLAEALGHSDLGVRRAAAMVLLEKGDRRAVPALIAATRDADDYLRDLALRALARIAAPEAIDCMAEFLRSGMPSRVGGGRLPTAEAMVEGLSRTGDPRAVPVLLEALRHSESGVRRLAIISLAKSRGTAAVDTIAELLDDPEGDVKIAAARALSTMPWEPASTMALVKWCLIAGERQRLAALGAKAIDPLIELIERHSAIAALAVHPCNTGSERDRITEALGQAFKNPSLAAPAAEALGSVGGDRAAELLGGGVGSLSTDSTVLMALAKIGTARAAEHLIKALTSQFGRDSAAKLLMQLPDVPIDPLVSLLESPASTLAWQVLESRGWRPETPQQRVYCALAEKNHKQAVEIATAAHSADLLLKIYSTGDNGIRRQIVDCLIELGPAGVLSLCEISAAEQGKKPRESRQATDASRALERVCDPAAVELLIEAVRGLDRSVMSAGLGVLGRLAGPEAIVPLLQAVRAGFEWEAADALREIVVRVKHAGGSASPEVANELSKAIDCQRLLHTDAKLMQTIAEAGGFIQDATPLIMALRKGKHWLLRDATAWLYDAALNALLNVQCRDIQPLLEASADGDLAREVVQILGSWMERDSAQFSEDALRAVVAMGEVIRFEYSGHVGAAPWHRPVDTYRLKQSARQELIRRGLQA